MRLTPSSIARRSTCLATSRSGGSPQTPFPVMRIAPKPSRRTDGPSSPMVKVPVCWSVRVMRVLSAGGLGGDEGNLRLTSLTHHAKHDVPGDRRPAGAGHLVGAGGAAGVAPGDLEVVQRVGPDIAARELALVLVDYRGAAGLAVAGHDPADVGREDVAQPERALVAVRAREPVHGRAHLAVAQGPGAAVTSRADEQADSHARGAQHEHARDDGE